MPPPPMNLTGPRRPWQIGINDHDIIALWGLISAKQTIFAASARWPEKKSFAEVL